MSLALVPGDLREWLDRVKEARDEAQVALQNGDSWPMRLWALMHGHALVAKVEELAGALDQVDRLILRTQVRFESRWSEQQRGDAFAYCNEARRIIEAALRVSGGGDKRG